MSRTKTLLVDDGSLLSKENRIMCANTAAECTFGYDREEVIGQPLDMLLTDDLRKIHRRHRVEFLASDESTKLANMRPEITGLRKNGEVFPATDSITKSNAGGVP